MNGLFDQATTDDANFNSGDELVREPVKVVETSMQARWLPARYQDLGAIARGSFGEVRRVHDTLLDRVVAMKVLHAEHARVDHIRRRFSTEVNITGQLQHPGIVAVHDRGELTDGRLWFTMKEVRGRTLSDVIEELHAGSHQNDFGTTPSGWTFRRLVDAFARIVQAVGYAHQCGIVHRDLKPENLMIGEFGEVLVMDWGLAQRNGNIEESAAPVFQGELAPRLTQHGDILGTPAFMSPEQAAGSVALVGPASDVYALGAILYCLLTGRLPYDGVTSRDILLAVLQHSFKPIRDVARIPIADELIAISERAMARDRSDRYPNASAMFDEIIAWLDGVRLREQALQALQHARIHEPEIANLRQAAEEARKRARALQTDLRPFDSVEKKRPAWQLEDEANRLVRAAALLETKWLEAVHGALSVDARLPEAHQLLAEHYREQLVNAEREHRGEDAARSEELLRIHDRGKHAAFLRGDGRLTLVTDPPDAEVFVDRFILEDRKLIAAPEGLIGKTPLLEVPLRHGSYLLRIRSPGRAEVRYPVLIERDGHWDGIAPEEKAPFPIYLPLAEELGPDDVYVPASYSWIGGDLDAADALPRNRVWIDAFVMDRFPVTHAQFLDFLNDLVKQGRVKEALQHCPRKPGATLETPERIYLQNADETFVLPPDRGPRFPAVLLDWYGASAYAAWLSERTNKAWRLPNELEREKAARSVDARMVPWGNHLDATFSCVVESHRLQPLAVSVDDFATDESPYGIRGLAGNVRDWCLNVWKLEGPRIESGRLQLDPAALDDDEFRVIRGGTFGGVMNYSRSAARFGGRPRTCWHVVGIRLARSITVKIRPLQ